MTTINITWTVTLSTAVLCAAVNIFAGWVGQATWKQVIQAIVLQWLALLWQVLVLVAALSSGG